MSLFIKIAFWAFVLFTLFFAAWYVINGDILFTADIGRDFHLLAELDEKKLVLIGPRSSTGLFHGPLWTYVNYPAYLLGGGNPIAVGWGWFLFVIFFGALSFYISHNLFNKQTAYLFTAIATLYAAYHAKGMFNPHGAMILIPLFFYLFVKYYKTGKVKFLIFHVAVLGAIIQFQMANGIPLFILSLTAIIYYVVKTKKYVHLAAFLLLPATLSNFILFDLRHEFLLTQKIVDFVSPQSNGQVFNYIPLIQDRIDLAFQGSEILRRNMGPANLILFATTLFLIFIQIKDNKYKLVYKSFLFFYFGFFAPYFERLRRRFSTPVVSSVPRPI